MPQIDTTSLSKQTRQALPNTMEQARAEQSYWEANLALAQVKFMVAKRQMEQAQDDLDLVKAVARGDFEEDAPKNGYVMSSRGPWCLGDQR